MSHFESVLGRGRGGGVASVAHFIISQEQTQVRVGKKSLRKWSAFSLLLTHLLLLKDLIIQDLVIRSYETAFGST